MDVVALLGWYRAHQRPLPWRLEVSAYRTLVSELMCQQTRVDTVLPYFAAFMKSFPTVEALAAAPTERVLERWSGLGYYRRARNLQAAAQAVVANGGFPKNLEGLLALPGVGPYTAGAIGSIALGIDAPVVDGNVERVLSRLHAVESPVKAWLWETAARNLPKGEAGDYNQALMELGAMVCAPRAPKCGVCPLRADCAGVGEPERYPAAKIKKAVPRSRAVAAWIVRDGRLLLARRPEAGLLGGLWELPGGTLAGADAASLSDVLLARVGARIEALAELGVIAHTFSHLHLETTVVAAHLLGEARPVDYPEVRWVPFAEVDGMALSSLARKTLALGRVHR